MKTTFRLYLALALMIFTSCASDSLRHDSQGHLLKSATTAFFQLQDAGKVPALAPGEHGDLQNAPLQRSETITYPVTVVMDVTKQKDHSLYAYRLTKDSDSSIWRLTAASHQLPDGRWEDLKIE